MQGISERHKVAIDISQYQGDIDFDLLASKEPLAVICRSYGADHSAGGDTRFVEYVTQLQARGIPVGSYFYCWIDDVDRLEDAREQAEMYISKLYEAFGEGNTGDLIPMLDLETNAGVTWREPTSGIRHDNLDTAKMLNWADEFRKHFESIAKVKLGIYTGHYWIEEKDNFLGDLNPLKNMPLWVAAFTKYGYSLEGGLTDKGGWSEWIGWQYSEDGNGAEWGVSSATIDLNYFEPLEVWSPEYYQEEIQQEGAINMPRRTGITSETVRRFLIDAGALYINYGLATERLLGATQGGNTFIVEHEIKEIELDGQKSLVKGARRITSVTARITTNLIEMTSENFQLALVGTDGTVGTDQTVIRRSREIGDMDYIENVAIVGTINGTSTPIVCIVENALADGNFELGQEDKEEATLEVQFTGHVDPADVNDNEEPWEVRFPTEITA